MSTTTRKSPTLAQFKRFSKDIAPAARAVLMARVHADLTRTRVDAYIRPVFDSFLFAYRGELADKCGLSGPLPSPRELYLCDDPLVPAFYADCDAAHRANGFTGPQGHCPALIAEHLVITTENLLIGLAGPLFGVEVHHLTSEQRAQYLDLIIGAALKGTR